MTVARRARESISQIPPHDLALERAVLGAGFYSVRAALTLAAEPEAIFYLEAHRGVRAAFAEAAPSLNGTPPDLALIQRLAGVEPTVTAGLFEDGLNVTEIARSLTELRELAAQREEYAAAVMVARHHEQDPTTANPELWRTVESRLAQARDWRRRGRGADNEPIAHPIGDDLRLEWPAHGISLTFSRLREGREGISSELAVTSAIHGELHFGQLNLLSTSARAGLVKALEQSAAVAPWARLLQRGCRLAALHLRTGEPAVCLMPRIGPDSRHLITKLILDGATNVLFGDGGSGKSTMATLLATAAGAVVKLPAGLISHGPVPVLDLDYEGVLEDHQDILARLMVGLGLPEPPPIIYRRMIRPLADEAALIRGLISEHRVGLVIVDSLAPACGPEPEGADAVVRCFSALRSFGPAARLVLAHVTKASADQRSGASRPFGSVFVQNLARNVWEIRRADDDDGPSLTAGFYHRKVNRGQRLPPFGLRFDFSDEAITVHGQDLAQQPELLARASLTYQIKKALAAGARSIPELAEETKGAKATIGRTLRRWRTEGKVIQVDPDRWGLKA